MGAEFLRKLIFKVEQQATKQKIRNFGNCVFFWVKIGYSLNKKASVMRGHIVVMIS